MRLCCHLLLLTSVNARNHVCGRPNGMADQANSRLILQLQTEVLALHEAAIAEALAVTAAAAAAATPAAPAATAAGAVPSSLHACPSLG
jgi:hypothetical protein